MKKDINMFKRNFMLLLLLVFLTFCCTAPVFASELDNMSEEEVMLALSAEPSLTQADIDTFIKNAPALQKFSENKDEAAYMQLIKEIGWSEIRAAYIPIKISAAWAMSQDSESAMFIQNLFPPEMLPRAEEQALVDKNIAKLLPLFNEE